MNAQDSNRTHKRCAALACCYYKGATNSMGMDDFLEACEMIWASFPDSHLTWDNVKEISPCEVMVENFKGREHHIGAQY